MFVKTIEIRDHSGAVFSLSSGGQMLYSASADRFVTRWNRITGEQDRFAIRFEKSPYSITSDDDFLYIGLNDGHLHQIDLNAKEERAMFRKDTSAIFSLCLNSERGHLYVGDAGGNLTVYSLTNLKPLLNLPFVCGKIREIKLSPDGREAILACQDTKIRFLNTETFNFREIQTNHSGGVNTFCFHPKKEWLITGGKDGHIRITDLRTEQEVLAIPAHNYAIYRLQQMGDHLLSVSRDKSIKVWDLPSLDFVHKLSIKEGGHNHSINDLAILSDQEFATCGDDRRIILWKRS